MRFIVSGLYLRVRGALVFHFEISPVVAPDLGDVSERLGGVLWLF